MLVFCMVLFSFLLFCLNSPGRYHVLPSFFNGHVLVISKPSCSPEASLWSSRPKHKLPKSCGSLNIYFPDFITSDSHKSPLLCSFRWSQWLKTSASLQTPSSLSFSTLKSTQLPSQQGCLQLSPLFCSCCFWVTSGFPCLSLSSCNNLLSRPRPLHPVDLAHCHRTQSL